jgi:hypothetical protein
MERVVQPELLDELPARDRHALRSRRDLQRLNAWMRHARIMARALQGGLNGRSARQIIELGAGDGHFFLRVARHLRGRWPTAEATLVDRLDVFDPAVARHFDRFGWHIQVEVAEAAEWLRQDRPRTADAIFTNLFLHQFNAAQLAELLRLAARSARVVIALEPRRTAWLYFCSRLLWLTGCCPVTRHDAPVSVRAGFAGHELTALWPDDGGWEIIERPAGLFSHLFVARRKD